MKRFQLFKYFFFFFIFAMTIAFTCCDSKEIPVVKEMARPAKIMTFAAGNLQQSRSLPGKVQPAQEAKLAFKVSDKLIELPVKEGQRVKKGQILARLDPRDFKTNLAKIRSSIEEAMANLRAMRAGERQEVIRALQAQIRGAQANLSKSKNDVERQKRLLRNEMVSQADYEDAKRQYDVALENLKQAQENLKKAQKGARQEELEAQQARIKGLLAQQQEVKNALNDTYLRAPFDGEISKVFVNNFQNIQAEQVILSLQDNSTLEIIVEVSEQLIITHDRNSKDRDNMNIVAVFEAIPNKKFPLTLKEFSTEANPDTSTYQVVLQMPAPQGINILPGMSCQVIHTEPLKEMKLAGSVPVTAIANDENNQSYIWIVDPETSRVLKRPVTVGKLAGNDLLILKGITPGEKFITAGVHYIHAGMLVKPLQKRN